MISKTADISRLVDSRITSHKAQPDPVSHTSTFLRSTLAGVLNMPPDNSTLHNVLSLMAWQISATYYLITV